MTRNKRATHEYISFFNPWPETSALHMNISRSLIHDPKQARYTWIDGSARPRGAVNHDDGFAANPIVIVISPLQ